MAPLLFDLFALSFERISDRRPALKRLAVSEKWDVLCFRGHEDWGKEERDEVARPGFKAPASTPLVSIRLG